MVETVCPTPVLHEARTNLCYYRNVTNRLQVIRLDWETPQAFEKIVFPGERLMFSSSPTAWLEIHTSSAQGLTLIERVPCVDLQVTEKLI